MSALSAEQLLTPAEYLALEQTSEIRHEYIDGRVYAMTGGTGNYNLICSNLLMLLRSALKNSPCRTYISDMKVNVHEQRRFFYPDLVVTCSEQDDPSRPYLDFPELIIEVLSPSTESFDRGQKFAFFRSIPSLKEYILVNTNQHLVECFRRQKQEMWLLQTYKDLTTIAHFESLDLDASLSDIYDTVEITADNLPDNLV